jgi:MFS transporter, putative metabolite:H+ symporter
MFPSDTERDTGGEIPLPRIASPAASMKMPSDFALPQGPQTGPAGDPRQRARITVAARLDRLPKSRYIRHLILLLSLGAWFEYYDLFFAAYIARAFYKSGIFTPTTRGFLGIEGFASFVAALFAGLFVGTLFFSRISDRFGRRAIFNFSLLWYSACTLAMAFQSTAGAINLWRFLAGVGIGVELVTIDTYVSELVPKATRGAAFAFNQFISFLAVPFVALISWLLVPRRPLGVDGWRWVVLIGASGAIFVWIIRRALPESPRWLEQNGQIAKADQVMDQIEQRVWAETRRELPASEPVAGAGPVEGARPVEGEAPVAGRGPLAGEGRPPAGSWSEIWNQTYRKRTILLVIFQLFQTLGFYGFASWVPTLLISNGIAVTKSLEYTFLIAIANPLAPLAGQAFADKVERKWQIAWAALAMAVFGLLFATQRTAAGVVVFGILITLSSNWMSFAFHAYQAELYPTRIRARAVGFVYSLSRLGAIASSFVIAFFLRNYGTSGVFLLIAAAMLIVFGVIGGLGPRTNGLRLEEIAR